VSLAPLIDHPPWFALLSGLWLVIGYAFDAYDPRMTSRFEGSPVAVIKAGLLTAALFLLLPRVTPTLPTTRLALESLPVFLVLAVLAGRRLYTWALPAPLYERHTLIVGAGWAGRTVAEALLDEGHSDYHVVGFIDDDPAKAEALVPVAGSRRGARAGLPVLGNRHTLKEVIGARRISTLILAITRDVDADLLQTLMDCVEKGVEMVPMPDLYEQLTGRVPVEHVGEKWYAAIPVHSKVTSPLSHLTKRIMDLSLAGLGMVCLLPLLPFIALAIVLDSPGPVFYSQERVGKGGAVFRAFKFRSMIPGAEQGEAVWAQERDPRVTRVGRILRATHVDEFPQFVNVLKGEMSAVGPRPERPEIAERLARELPIYRLRHVVKPGMGGWGLVRQGYAGSPDDALLRLQYDLYYIKHESLWLDLLIVLKTIVHAVTLKGR
jgi:exopolysaccharide biosynthesis polyprenyl glycosylphosphotransferase